MLYLEMVGHVCDDHSESEEEDEEDETAITTSLGKHSPLLLT